MSRQITFVNRELFDSSVNAAAKNGNKYTTMREFAVAVSGIYTSCVIQGKMDIAWLTPALAEKRFAEWNIEIPVNQPRLRKLSKLQKIAKICHAASTVTHMQKPYYELIKSLLEVIEEKKEETVSSEHDLAIAA